MTMAHLRFFEEVLQEDHLSSASAHAEDHAEANMFAAICPGNAWPAGRVQSGTCGEVRGGAR